MGKGKGKGIGSGSRRDDRGTLEKITVPAMPMPMAIICCVINFILPGFGTIVAGFTLFCCGRNDGLDSGSKLGGCCICFGIGIAQLLVAFLFFPCGWAWSIMWGIYFIGISSQYYNINDPNRPPSRGAVIYPAPGYSAQPMPSQPAYGYGNQPAYVYGYQPAYGYTQSPGVHVHTEQPGVKVHVNVVNPPPQQTTPQTMPAQAMPPNPPPQQTTPQTMPAQAMPPPAQYNDLAPPAPTYPDYTGERK